MPLQIIRYDITKMRVDAIVNTTNEEMIGYSYVRYLSAQKTREEVHPHGLGHRRGAGFLR